MIVKNRFPAFIPLVLLLLLGSCRGSKEKSLPQNGGILTPLTQSVAGGPGSEMESSNVGETSVLPLVNPGSSYNILALLDINLDLEQSDEQVIVSLPINKPEANLQLMVASTNPIRNQYDIVWTAALTTRNLTGIILRSDDLTGNGRNDVIVTGFDEKGQHVTEVFAVSKRGEIGDFRKVFSLSVDGNIDIISEDRSPGYFSGVSAGVPYRITVQKQDPTSESGLDIIETDWRWDQTGFIYRQGESRKIRGETILEDRMGVIYTGDVGVYEKFLKGAWYRETGEGIFLEMLYFDPEKREIMFYDGSIQEIFTWGESHRTTAKRLYTRVTNAVIPSLYDTVSVSAESWDRIELWRAAANWNGIYRRLGPALQTVLDNQSAIPPILAPLSLTGVWRSPGGAEIIFDLPGVEWIEGGNKRSGTASLFNLGNTLVLQIQFMKANGSVEESVSWKTEYREDRDATRVIRSLSLSPAELKVDGVRSTGTIWRRYEQIEVIAASE